MKVFGRLRGFLIYSPSWGYNIDDIQDQHFDIIININRLHFKAFDHNSKKYLKGFRLLTLGCSDGNSFPGLDFAILSSASDVRYGNPAEIITDFSADVDMAVMGYRKKGALLRTLVGSAGKNVLKHSSKPILLVPIA